MIKILFICHGNICRSPMAEFIMKDMVKKAGREAEFEIASAGVSSEELGRAVYPPAKRILNAHGIKCEGHCARKIRPDDYERYDYLIAMDSYNMRGMHRAFNGDKAGKMHMLLDFAGRKGEDVDDPWYSGNFETAWSDIYAGCTALFEKLCQPSDDAVTLDFSACRSRRGLYAVLREKLDWQDWYGENLDALWDILTAQQRGARFRIIPPVGADEAVRDYAALMATVFAEAGCLEN